MERGEEILLTTNAEILWFGILRMKKRDEPDHRHDRLL